MKGQDYLSNERTRNISGEKKNLKKTEISNLPGRQFKTMAMQTLTTLARARETGGGREGGLQES